MKFLKAVLFTLAICALILKLPQVHYQYVRHITTRQSVKITRTDGVRSGGTGTHVKLPSGGVAILTNAHICALQDNKGYLLVDSPYAQRPIPRRVIEISDFTDLCLVEPLPGFSGLSLGSNPEPGDIIAITGHPQLMPDTMTRGEVIGEGEALVLDHVMPRSGDDGSCDAPKNKILTVGWFFGTMDICVLKIPATYTTVTILPGNSGSAAVNAWGHLVGLAFAGNSDSNWGILVTLTDIKQFLNSY